MEWRARATFSTFPVRLKYPSQTCPSDVHSLVVFFLFCFSHPLGATEEAPCHNPFVRSSRKLEARRLREQGQSNKSCVDKRPADAAYDGVYRLYVEALRAAGLSHPHAPRGNVFIYLHTDVPARNISVPDLNRGSGEGGSYCPAHVGRKIRPDTLPMPKGTRYFHSLPEVCFCLHLSVSPWGKSLSSRN